MRRRIAHGLAIAFLIVGLGAAQGPNISEAKPAPVSSVQVKPEVRKQVEDRNRIKLGQRPGTGRLSRVSRQPAASRTICTT